MRSHGLSGTNWSSHNAYHSDANGNVTALVNSSGVLQASHKYNPYGGLISSSGALASANRMRFSSKPAIFSSSGAWGFYYYGYRFYDPANQRWLNRDPAASLIGWPDQDAGQGPADSSDGGYDVESEPVSRAAIDGNLYRGIGNEPNSLTDGLGLSPSLNPQNQAWACQAMDVAANKAARNAARLAARQALEAGRSAANDQLRRALLTRIGQAAHHRIPWAERTHQLVKQAARGGWNLNGAGNGVNLPNAWHSGFGNWHRWHKYYNEYARPLLDRAWKRNPNMSAEEAALEAQRIADILAKYAQRTCRPSP